MPRPALALLALSALSKAYFVAAAPAVFTTYVPSTTVIAVETQEVFIDLGPDYYVDPDYAEQEFATTTIYGVVGVTPPASTVLALETSFSTPATSTIYSETVSTSTPPTRTVTSTFTPSASTVYETSWTTTQPATSTVTAVATVSTGSAACLDYRLVFHADCCPSEYVRLLSLKRRQADAATTETVISGATTVTQTVYTREYEPRPEVAVSAFVYVDGRSTFTAPTPIITSTSLVVEAAPTPLVTATSTRVVTADEPVATVWETAPAGTETRTVTSTSTRPTPVTTTTSTAGAQATACAQKTVWTQKACPASNLVKNLVQDVQVTKLKLYKALGGKFVLVDCGAAGTFRY
ncbi:hypothetical protein JCM10450v2_006707 [Rhodotorula kratochvilovae]